MPEVLEGTVGIWGIASTEIAQGVIIESISEVIRSEKNPIRDNKGCRIGRSEYDESIEGSLKGEVLAASEFGQKLGAELAMTNAVSLVNLNAAGPGKTLIDEVKKERGREAWQDVVVDFEVLPFFPAV